MAGIIGGGGSLSLPTLIQKIKVSADTADAESKVASSTQKIGSTITKAGIGLTAGLTVPIVAFAASAVGAASDLNESVSKVGVVFGESAQSVLTWSDTTATALGISKNAALEAAGTFGNLFAALGIGQPIAADMSIKLVQLASDLASFNNADPSEVLQALQSGLVGEVEPLRKFGVSLSAARIESEALATGILKPFSNFEKIEAAQQRLAAANENVARTMKENGKESIEFANAQKELADATDAFGKETKGNVPELDAAAKAQASYQAIMKDTALAQGDFSRTSDGLANQQRIMAAQFEDAKGKLGQGLLPVMIQLTGVVNGVLQAFLSLPAGGQKIILMGLGLLAVLGPLLIVLGKIISSAKIVGTALGFSGQAKGLSSLTKVFSTVTKFAIANPWILIAVAAVAAVILIVKNWDKIKAFFAKLWEVLTKAATAAWSAITGAASAALDALKGIVSRGWQALQDVTSSLFGALLSFLSNWWKTLVLAVFTAGLAILVRLVIENWGAIRDATVAIFSAILSFLSSLPGRIGAIFSAVFDVVWSVMSAMVGYLASLPGQIIGSLWSLVTSLPGLFWDAVNGAYEAVVSSGSAIIDFMAGLPGQIIGALGDIGSILLDAGWSVIQGFIDGITGALPALWDTVSGIPGGVLDFFKDGLGIGSPAKKMIPLGLAIPQGVVVGITSGAGEVERAMTNLVQVPTLAPFPVSLADGPRQALAGGSASPVVSTSTPTSVDERTSILIQVDTLQVRSDEDIVAISRGLANQIDEKKRARGIPRPTARPA